MSQDGNAASRIDRRKALKSIGVATVAGLAGCGGQSGSSGGGEGTSSGGSSGGSTSSGGSSDEGSSGGSTSQSGEWPDLSGQSLHYLTSDTSTEAQNFWMRVANDFKEATGCDINIEFAGFAGEGIVPRVSQLLQAGDPPEATDLDVGVATQFLPDDQLMPLDQAMETLIDRYGEPTSAKRLVIDGTNYNVPLKSSYLTMWYRSDLSDATPDTWESMMEYVQDVESNSDVNGTYLPTGTGLHALLNHMAWAYTEPTTMVRRSGGQIQSNLANDRETWSAVLSQLKELYQYSPTSTDSDFGALIQAIPTENAASNPYIGVRPKNAAIRQEREFAEAVTPLSTGMPMAPSSSEGKVEVGGGGLVSFKGADQEVANTWIEFLTQPEYYLDLFSVFAPVHYTAPWPGLKERDDYFSRLQDAAPDGWTEEQIRTVQYDIPENHELIHPANEISPPNRFFGPITSEEPITTMVTEALVKDTDVDAAIDKADETVSSVLSSQQ